MSSESDTNSRRTEGRLLRRVPETYQGILHVTILLTNSFGNGKKKKKAQGRRCSGAHSTKSRATGPTTSSNP